MKKIILFVIVFALNGCQSTDQTGRGTDPADSTLLKKKGVNGPNADSTQNTGYPKGDLK